MSLLFARDTDNCAAPNPRSRRGLVAERARVELEALAGDFESFPIGEHRRHFRRRCLQGHRREEALVIIDLLEHALAVLFVVGNAGDTAAVEPLLSHRDERVRKAARTCLFEIRRRPAEA